MMPKDTPEFLKDPEAVADLVQGAILEDADGVFYRAKRLADSPMVLLEHMVKV